VPGDLVIVTYKEERWEPEEGYKDSMRWTKKIELKSRAKKGLVSTENDTFRNTPKVKGSKVTKKAKKKANKPKYLQKAKE